MKLQLLSCAKACISICIIYILWLAEIQIINVVLYGSVVLAVIFALLDAASRKVPIRHAFPSFNRMLVIFGLSSFLIGSVIAPEKEQFFSSMVTYFSFTIITLLVCYISYRTESTTWVRRIFLISALLCAISATFNGFAFRTERVYVTTMSPINNPNTLGLIMVIGIFALVINEEALKKHLFINVATVLWFMLVIVKTGSRKALLGGALLFLIWYITLLRSEKGRKSNRKIILWLTLFGVGVGLVYYVLNEFIYTSSYQKFINVLAGGEGLTSRTSFYREAFQIWKDHPIFGVGYNQFQVVSPSGKFSHTTYGELLSCTGVIGTFIFLSNLVSGYSKTTRLVIRGKRNKKYEYTIFLLMFTVELLLATGMILFYSVSHMLVFTYIFYNIEHEQEFNV